MLAAEGKHVTKRWLQRLASRLPGAVTVLNGARLEIVIGFEDAIYFVKHYDKYVSTRGNRGADKSSRSNEGYLARWERERLARIVKQEDG